MFLKLLDRKFLAIWLALLLSAILTINSNAAGTEGKRLRVKHDVECYIPYESNLPINEENPNITHLIVPVYSPGSNVYNSCIELVEKHNHDKNNIIVLSPQFLINGQVGEDPEPNLLYWNVRPFYGSKISTTKAFSGDLRVSAYQVLEDIIADACTKTTFPNLNRITILGHSAGGQLVNRFAASNAVEFDIARPQNVHIRYIPMNPSSFIYFSPKRSIDWSNRNFAIPTNPSGGYNNYPYGLDALYSYQRRKGITGQRMRERYPQRDIIYLIGQKDCVPCGNMSTHPFAMIQGRNRMERVKIYWGHLIDEFGPEIQKNQKLRVAKGVGHSGKGMILSPPGRVSILAD